MRAPRLRPSRPGAAGPGGSGRLGRLWSRGRRALLILVLILCLIAAALAALIWRILPPQNDVITIPGVSAPVGIAFDSNDIPYIRAASDTDAAMALGYVHARDRFFQMDLMRRAAGGTLAALLGPRALPNDEEMRILGLRRSAEADAAALSPQARAMLSAYAAGVNAWLARRGRFAAPEYLLLGKPKPWTIVDSLLWGKMMGLWLSGNWRTELARLALSAHLTRAEIDSLWPGAGPLEDRTGDGTEGGAGDRKGGSAAATPPPYPPGAAAAAAHALALLRHFPQGFTLPARASNAWVLAGDRTETGRPLLAGDPHLGYGFPGLWYLARIDTPDHSLAGATVPGVPFLVIGHNQHIAWSFTSTGADTEDVFIETVTDGGKDYETPGGPRPFGHRRVVIAVRGRPDVVLDVRTTRHGPVIGAGPSPNTVLTVEMATTAPQDTDADGLLALDEAQTVAQAGAAAPQITSPVQNLLVADTAGAIGFFTTGRVPIRRAGDGAWPEAGADGAHDWVGWASGAALPHAIDPASGMIVNANQPMPQAAGAPLISRDTYADWRARRITALLDQSDRQTLDRFGAIQMDVTSLFARSLLPALRAVTISTPGAARQAAGMMQRWNGLMAADRPEPLIFTAWMRSFGDRVLKAAGVPSDSPAVNRAALLRSLLVPGPDQARAEAFWCGGDCRPYLAPALTDAVGKLSRFWGRNPARWRWGRAHQALFAHPVLARLPVIGGLGEAQVPVPGSAETVDVQAPAYLPGRSEFTALHGPELRTIEDLANLDRSRFMIAPGQSGDLLDQHAFDLLQTWRAGGMVELGPEPNVVSRQIRIMPKSPP
ncbi:penicillin acylase family protein [Acidisoma sp. C75]